MKTEMQPAEIAERLKWILQNADIAMYSPDREALRVAAEIVRKGQGMKDPNIKIGQVVYWVHCSNKVYKGLTEEYSFCEGQGALYLILHSPSFQRNPYPCVHYTNCFTTREEAEEYAEFLKSEGTFCKRCDRCEFNLMQLVPLERSKGNE